MVFVHQMDVKIFQNGNSDEEIHREQPEGICGAKTTA